MTRSRHPGAMLIYKIFREAEWAELIHAGETRGAPVDLADGFVHFSTAAQVAETARRYFAGEPALWLLAVESDGLDALKWEPSRGGDLFPHLFRPLRLADLVWVRRMPLGPDGHVFPEGMA